jgi:hypothetical protein
MKQGRTLQDLAAEIERRKETKKDYTVRANALRMTAMDIDLDPKHAQVGFWLGDQRYGVNNIAHEQIAAYLKIPMAYYWRMLAEAPELLARNVNQWFEDIEADKLRMARTMDGKLRAFLSNGYRRFENEDFAEAVLPVIADLGLDIMSCEITERRLYIKAVDPKVTREIKQLGGAWGDGKHIIKRGCAAPAVTLSNSETGDGRLSVLGGIYQDWCTNLASFGGRSLKKTHLGARHELIEGEELYELLTDETKKKTDEALWLQVRDTVKATFDAVKFNELIDKVEGAQAEPIDGDPVKVVAAASKKFGASEGQQKSVLKHLIEGGSLSRFGLYNAFTRMAQDVDDYDEATRFEQVGGRIIELPHTEWRALAKAA